MIQENHSIIELTEASERTRDNAKKAPHRESGERGASMESFGLLDVLSESGQVNLARHVLQPSLIRRLDDQARQLDVSCAAMVHAAWGLVLSRTNSIEAVVYGVPARGGTGVGVVPLELCLAGVTARELIEQAERKLVERASFDEVLPMPGKEFGSGSVPSECTTVLCCRPEWNTSADGYAFASELSLAHQMVVTIHEREVTVATRLRIEPQRIVAYLLTALESLTSSVQHARQTQALHLPILPHSERRQVVELFNATHASYRRHTLVHELFEEQVQRTPDAPAIMHGTKSITYAEVNCKANHLASRLVDAGIKPDQLVGVCVQRGVEIAIALLGILKAGGAYVPLDASYPRERLQYMLNDSKPRVVLTQDRLRDVLPIASPAIMVLTASEFDECIYENQTASARGLTSQNLLYVIYTSGSTGQPKGIAMTHGAMVNLIEWQRTALPTETGTRVLQFAPLSFDVAFQEIFTTLSAGGTLVFLDEWVRSDARALVELLSRDRVERLFVPPLLLQSVAEHFRSTSRSPRDLKDIIVAGEQLHITPEIIELFKHLGRCRLHNHYGPTETHVVTALTLGDAPDEWPSLPGIGKPIANTQIYVLDSQQQPIPLDAVGEIYIGGANLARDYLNRPDLTMEKFQPDPFVKGPHGRMYSTGDLGRWRADGTLQYLGRSDEQVKIRGFRVELAEIEAHIARHEQVKEAAVVAREYGSGEKRLAAYVTLRVASGMTAEVLRDHLRSALPHYMVPSTFVLLDRLPLTPTGKLDRRALVAMTDPLVERRPYDPPEGETEQILAAIWQELVQVARVGRQDHILELGGSSLTIMRLLVKITERFAVELYVQSILSRPLLHEMAELIEIQRRQKTAPSEAAGTEFEQGVI